MARLITKRAAGFARYESAARSRLPGTGSCPGVVADLPGGHEEAQRPLIRIADGVQFGVHAAFRAADQAAEIPFFTRRLDAVRCAFR
jgi:hypothetical protein